MVANSTLVPVVGLASAISVQTPPPAGAAYVPSPRKKVVVLLGHFGTNPCAVELALAVVTSVSDRPPSGRPVQSVNVPDDGVPNAGVTRVGEFDKTTLVVPVEAVTPVPPRATASVPVVSDMARVVMSARLDVALSIWAHV